MTVLSAALGVVVPALIPHYVTHYLSAAFFLIFGVKMLKEYWGMSDDEGKEELEVSAFSLIVHKGSSQKSHHHHRFLFLFFGGLMTPGG